MICAKKCCFFYFGDAISGMPAPETCLVGAV